MISLDVQKRKIGDSLQKLRKEGFMPGVFYGKKEESTPVSIKLNDFLKVWKDAGESAVVTLKVKDGENLEALVHDVDRDPVSEVPLHADFYVFEKGQKITIKVPIEFSGVSLAVKDLAGILIKVKREIEIEAMPKDLPREISVDISPLVNFESQILLKDVVLPTGVVLPAGSNANEVVALVTEAKEEVVEEVPVDLSAIEVEKKGKKEEEGAEGAGAAGAGASGAAGSGAKGEKSDKPEKGEKQEKPGK